MLSLCFLTNHELSTIFPHKKGFSFFGENPVGTNDVVTFFPYFLNEKCDRDK